MLNLKLDFIPEPTVVKYLHQRKVHKEDPSYDVRIHFHLCYLIKVEADHTQTCVELEKHDRSKFLVHHFAKSVSS